MNKWGMLRRFLFLCALMFSTPAFSQEGMTEAQNVILRQTMSVGGSITKEMHEKFWADVPKGAVGQWNPLFLWLLNNTKLAQIYQRALWQSALFSYEQNEIIRTEALGKSEKAISDFIVESAPFKKGSKEYDSFLKAYRSRMISSEENARRLLEAAARHQNLEAVNGEVVKIDDMLIKSVLDRMNEGFGRLELLIDPVWKG
jgi:hypothetical protein